MNSKGSTLVILILIVCGVLITIGAWYFIVQKAELYSSYVTPEEPSSIGVKFKDEAVVRLREGKLVSLAGYDLSEFQNAIARYPQFHIKRMHSLPEERLDELRETGMKNTGKQLPDLNSWYVLIPSEKNPALSDKIAAELRSLSIVEHASRGSRVSLPN